MYFFGKESIDAKSVLKFEKCPLVAELKLKMVPDVILTFSPSAQSLEGAFQKSVHFLHLWKLCQKKKHSDF